VAAAAAVHRSITEISQFENCDSTGSNLQRVLTARVIWKGGGWRGRGRGAAWGGGAEVLAAAATAALNSFLASLLLACFFFVFWYFSSELALFFARF
jgi:hypothetical protein